MRALYSSRYAMCQSPPPDSDSTSSSLRTIICGRGDAASQQHAGNDGDTVQDQQLSLPQDAAEHVMGQHNCKLMEVGGEALALSSSNWIHLPSFCLTHAT